MAEVVDLEAEGGLGDSRLVLRGRWVGVGAGW